jgi:hypothetical protein
MTEKCLRQVEYIGALFRLRKFMLEALGVTIGLLEKELLTLPKHLSSPLVF